jgi:hypothetical protein
MSRFFHTAAATAAAMILATACSGGEPESRPLTVVALGDAGQPGGVARATSHLLADMYSGRHDGGVFDVMIFLGDNFLPTGLNVPPGDVEGRVKETLAPYKVPMEALGRDHVLAIPGEHDYYARNAIETSALFGLIKIAEFPTGLSGRGNERAREIAGWTYHHAFPGEAVFPLSPGSNDSVQFVLIDSALPLRSPPRVWTPALDSLGRLLARSRSRPGITWRILCMHHPFRSLGEHGGYSFWNEERHGVDFVSPCDRDSNAVGWIRNLLDPEDLCTERYDAFMRSLRRVIHESGVKIPVVLSAHDRSMQLLDLPADTSGCAECPSVQIISGAASLPSIVREAAPPHEFTSASGVPSKQGVSAGGCVQLTFHPDLLHVVFFDAARITPADMGGGRTAFDLTTDGRFKEETP